MKIDDASCAPIVYSCAMTVGPLADLCTHVDATFNTATGDYSFSSTDLSISNFGTQAVDLEITGTATTGGASLTITVSFNLIDPCSVADFSIGNDVIENPITYDVYVGNFGLVRPTKPNEVTFSPDSALCPPIEFSMKNNDNSPLDPAIHVYSCLEHFLS